MRYIICYFLLLLILISCKENKISNPIFINNETNKDTIRNLYPNGTLKEILISKGDTTEVTSYYRNGFIKTKGNLYFNMPVGVWEEYRKKNILTSKGEYIIENGKSYLNQVIFFNDDQSINYNKSFFYKISNNTLKYFTPLDTLNTLNLKEREIKLIVYDSFDKEIKIDFDNKNEVIVKKDYRYPYFILESASIKQDSIINNENLIRIINRQIMVTSDNML